MGTRDSLALPRTSEVPAPERPPSEVVQLDHVLEYVRTHGYPDAKDLTLGPLVPDEQVEVKAIGYGQPVRVHFFAADRWHDWVIRTLSSDTFGHDRRSDRFGDLVLAFDRFNRVPRHIRAIDVGTVGVGGQMRSIARGEPFLVTTFAEGRPYAEFLTALTSAEKPSARDVAHTDTLAKYLAELHQERASAARYRRAVRDLVGHGEGIFGLTDSYPEDDPVCTQARLEALEQSAIPWRYRLKKRVERARTTHGDFHPFNLLFTEQDELVVLDTSRGSAGDPADDVTCLSVNYLFFSLTERGAFEGALRALWDRFWSTYLEDSADDAVLSVVAPFFAWRLLVLASPVWYPNVRPMIRDRLIRFAERLLDGAAFDPAEVDRLLA